MNPELLAKYKEKIEDLILQGHNVKVPPNSGQLKGRKWYIPRHCVTSKFRVVFVAGTQFQQTSLNDQIFPGPDLINNLVGVLTRVRKYPATVVGDVRPMFFQVQVAPLDQSTLSFLWWTDSDSTRPPKEYQMDDSPLVWSQQFTVGSWICFARTAEENRANVSEDVAEVVRKIIYVDDVLISAPDVDSAVKLTHDLKALLPSGGFELAELSINLPQVFETLPAERLGSELSQVDLYAVISKQKMLGLVWYPQEDVLGVKVSEVT